MELLMAMGLHLSGSCHFPLPLNKQKSFTNQAGPGECSLEVA